MKTFLKILFDLVFRLTIIMGVVIGYEVGSQVDGTIHIIVLLGTGFIASVLIGLYGQLYDKYIKW